MTIHPLYSTYDTGSCDFPELWTLLRKDCIEVGAGCDVFTIPHDPNLADGLMLQDSKTPQEASDRIFFEPVVESTQHMASSSIDRNVSS